MAQRMDTAMVEVLVKLKSITEHLRKNEFSDTSNKISKSVNEIVSVFGKAALSIGEDKMLMDEELPQTRQEPAQGLSADANRQDGKNELGMVEQEFKKTMEDIRQASSQDTPLPQNMPLRQSKSWAKVVATGPAVDGGIPTKPQGMTAHSEPRPVGPGRPSVPSGDFKASETDEEEAGMLTVTGNFGPRSLNHITSNIREGPLFSVEISPRENTAQIIFQRRCHAVQFSRRNTDLTLKYSYGCFGPGYVVHSILPLEWTDAIRQMENRPKERRRLTFARAGLIGRPISFKQFQADISSVAGRDNVDFVWAFNGGNATAAFKSVDVARLVLKHFVARANGQGPYKGVQVTYSTDPCEKPLSLNSTHTPGGQSLTTKRPPGRFPKKE